MKAKRTATPPAKAESVEEYFTRLAEPARSTLQAVREAIRAAAPPEATEGFSYGVPAFKLNQALAGYAAGRKFCSYYPMSGRVITKLAQDLSSYETTSGSIHFALDKPLPASLIKKLVKARMAELVTKKKPETA
jgi:uncharacterized protein YdhG (YjbR/CyaY superfamily)